MQFNRGATYLLRKKLWEAELFCKRSVLTFSSVINVTSDSPTFSKTFSDEDDIDDDDSDDV